MAIIRTRKGEEIIVDDDKFEELNRFTWFINRYAYTSVPNKYIKSDKKTQLPMHRYLTNCPKGLEVDHINGNKLDNRLENLEVVTHEVNARRSLWKRYYPHLKL
jgi:hypothetical protein